MKWTKEKLSQVQDLIDQKKSRSEIAQIMGTTLGSIESIIGRYPFTGLKQCVSRLQLKKCEFCGKEFQPKKSKQKFCSYKCYYSSSKKTYSIVCQECGKIINSQSPIKNKFCSLECFNKNKHKQEYQKIINGDESIMRANYSPKNYKSDIIKEQDGKCAICGMEQKWNGKQLVFVLDHIDGRAANNKRDNLRCVCPNCDSQLDTYKSKNKNSDREYYHYHHR